MTTYTDLYALRRRDLQALWDSFRRAAVINQRYFTRDGLFLLLSQQPAPRFYIDAQQAGLIIRRYYRGILPNTEYKKQMATDLVNTYEQLKQSYPLYTTNGLYEMTVEQPAKSFYLSPRRIKEILFNYTGR